MSVLSTSAHFWTTSFSRRRHRLPRGHRLPPPPIQVRLKFGLGPHVRHNRTIFMLRIFVVEHACFCRNTASTDVVTTVLEICSI